MERPKNLISPGTKFRENKNVPLFHKSLAKKKKKSVKKKKGSTIH